ncbi:hypothetical protein ARTSIC4J27_788 [Pseudarthrobacter siccitolerans]|uniref:Uncharacterized protein n=1 Tax=Pseudarthrobacter siccitolerans TaxID=861266 RepID=A0A024GYK8_9MICC|nr:hypothetical protein ARTSIC4J27_788 [Pseudarthrobacter siccitolerans]
MALTVAAPRVLVPRRRARERSDFAVRCAGTAPAQRVLASRCRVGQNGGTT